MRPASHPLPGEPDISASALPYHRSGSDRSTERLSLIHILTPGGIFDAYKQEITVWGRADLKDVDDSNLGLKGSPTQIAKASDKVRKGAGQMFTFDTPDEAASFITEKLQEKHVI